MDRELFEAVRQKSLAQWSHRTVVRSKSDQLLTGLLFDDAGHRMIPTHATKAGIRYRYYVSTPLLQGEAKTASAGSISRIPAVDIEEVVVKFLKEHLAVRLEGRDDLVELVTGIVAKKGWNHGRVFVRLRAYARALTESGTEFFDAETEGPDP